MTNNSFVRSELAQVALELAPPLIRKSLLEEPSFQAEYSLKPDGLLTFADPAITIQRSDLFNAVRRVLSGTAIVEISNMDDRKWELKNTGMEGEIPRLSLSLDQQNLILPDLVALSPDSLTRLRYLDETASDVNLPSSARDVWRDILIERSLEDDEVDAFLSEFQDTPVQKARAIRNEILGREEIRISFLVPPSRRYFERLIGAYDGSITVRDYATSTVRTLFDQLSAWRPYDGFLFSLLLSSHSSITAEINSDQLSAEDLLRAFDFLEKQGDRTSQLGAIEVGLRILPSRLEIEPILIRLIKQIRDDDVDGKASGFNLLSALFFLVDGELSRTRLLSAEPPFYRRLAALSQAALIYRQLVNSTVDIDHFCKWAISNRGEIYYVQSLADMYLEPRWNPEYGAASQLKADFFGRIMIAAKNYEQNIRNDELSDLVLGTKSGSLHTFSDFLHPYLPGPLEGAEESHHILPVDISEAIEKQLSSKEIGVSSFIALVNSALIFHVDIEQADLAARVLKLGNYRLASIEDRSQLLAVLNGLAAVAAVTRSRALSDELRIIVRKYRRDAQYALSIQEVMRICLVAAASRADLKDWREFSGDWLTELAFSELEGNEGEILYSYLQHLCHVVPELWVSCGRADAALMAYNASRHPA